MPIIIGLLILIILIMLFGPWLLLALAVVIGALVAGVVWVVKTLLVPAAIILAGLAALAVLAYVLLGAWVGAEKLTSSMRLPKLRSRKEEVAPPLPPIVRSRPKTPPFEKK